MRTRAMPRKTRRMQARRSRVWILELRVGRVLVVYWQRRQLSKHRHTYSRDATDGW